METEKSRVLIAMEDGDMLDTKIASAARLLIFEDDTVIRPGTLCTVLGEQRSDTGETLLQVVFIDDGVKRFVKPGEVRES